MKYTTILIISIVMALSASITTAADKKAPEATKSTMTAAEKEAMAAIEAAEKSRKKAASVEGEWRDTGKIIKKAKAAMKDGNTQKAIKLAKFAERQGQYGYEQAVSQKDFKMPSYLKY